MNSKRRAELQRKLSMGAIPRPPADLAGRIKADIPKYLEPERSRFTPSLAFSMRIAASLILLITTAVVTIRLVEPEANKGIPSQAARMERPVPAIMKGIQPKAADTAAAPSEEVRVEITQDLPASIPATAPAAPRLAPARQVARAEEAREFEGGEAKEERDAVALGQAAAPPPPPPQAMMAEALPVPAPAPVAPPVAPAAAEGARERITVTASAPLVSRAFADSLDLAKKKSVFGISVDPESFRSIKTDLENGTRPEPGRVNVDALVNYFAGAPARAPRRDVSLEVEASPAPVKADGNRAILRFTIDTARIDVAQNASTPPIAIDAKLHIDFNENAVANFRRVGNASAVTAEPILLHNLSVTGLYEIELKPKLKSAQRVATVRLTYRNVTTGREQKITRVIHGHDLAKEWARASRRHRLASLGAVWSETLKGSAANGDVAKRAEELAAQNPKDARARDLADAARESGGGGS